MNARYSSFFSQKNAFKLFFLSFLFGAFKQWTVVFGLCVGVFMLAIRFLQSFVRALFRFLTKFKGWIGYGKGITRDANMHTKDGKTCTKSIRTNTVKTSFEMKTILYAGTFFFVCIRRWNEFTILFAARTRKLDWHRFLFSNRVHVIRCCIRRLHKLTRFLFIFVFYIDWNSGWTLHEMKWELPVLKPIPISHLRHFHNRLQYWQTTHTQLAIPFNLFAFFSCYCSFGHAKYPFFPLAIVYYHIVPSPFPSRKSIRLCLIINVPLSSGQRLRYFIQRWSINHACRLSEVVSVSMEGKSFHVEVQCNSRPTSIFHVSAFRMRSIFQVTVCGY